MLADEYHQALIKAVHKGEGRVQYIVLHMKRSHQGATDQTSFLSSPLDYDTDHRDPDLCSSANSNPYSCLMPTLNWNQHEIEAQIGMQRLPAA